MWRRLRVNAGVRARRGPRINGGLPSIDGARIDGARIDDTRIDDTRIYDTRIYDTRIDDTRIGRGQAAT